MAEKLEEGQVKSHLSQAESSSACNFTDSYSFSLVLLRFLSCPSVMIVDRNELSTRLRLVQAENNPRRKQKNVRDNDRARSRSILLRYRDPRSIVISSQQGSNLLHLVARHSNLLFIYCLFNCSALASLYALYVIRRRSNYNRNWNIRTLSSENF